MDTPNRHDLPDPEPRDDDLIWGVPPIDTDAWAHPSEETLAREIARDLHDHPLPWRLAKHPSVPVLMILDAAGHPLAGFGIDARGIPMALITAINEHAGFADSHVYPLDSDGQALVPPGPEIPRESDSRTGEEARIDGEDDIFTRMMQNAFGEEDPESQRPDADWDWGVTE